jgi:hypothetical protein
MRNLLLITCVAIVSFSSFSQLPQHPVFHGQVRDSGLGPLARINTGKIENLDVVNEVGIVYNYTEMTVGMGMKENVYVEKAAAFINKKHPGEGDRFKAEWDSNKTKIYEPAFESAFNFFAKEKNLNITGANYTDKEFTLEVIFVQLFPTSVFKNKEKVYSDIECVFKDKENNVLCKFYMKNMNGNIFNGGFELTDKIAASVAMSAEHLCASIRKERDR